MKFGISNHFSMELIYGILFFRNRLIDNEQPAVKSTRFGWTAYYNVNVIHAWLDEKLKQFPKILKNVVIGRSFENRTIRGVRLSHRKVNEKN